MALITPTKFARAGQGGTVEIATYSGSIPALTGANAATVKTALDALTYTDLGDFAEFSINTVRGDEQTYFSDKCGVGLYSRTFQVKEDVAFTRQDASNIAVYDKFMDVYLESTATTRTAGYNFEAKDSKFVVLKFTACDLPGFDITYAADGTKKIVDTHYVVKLSLTSEFAKRYYALGNEQTFEGSPMEFAGEVGGLYLFHREELAI